MPFFFTGFPLSSFFSLLVGVFLELYLFLLFLILLFPGVLLDLKLWCDGHCSCFSSQALV